MRLMKWFLVLVLVLAGVGLGWMIQARLQEAGEVPTGNKGEIRPVPVEVVDIERGAIDQERFFTGTLTAHAEFLVAPKVGGRIEQLHVDLADAVTRGQVVAELDNAEYVQAVRLAEADLAVAQANLAEARSLLQIAERELQRIDKLRDRGVTSESQRDVAKADQLAKQAHVEVTRAQVERARAELELARIRLGYTQVRADWRGGDRDRAVAERLIDEGVTVSANTPLLRIVEVDPVIAVFFVTERDYALLNPEQDVGLRTDAYPGEVFEGRIVRIAPVFRESVRQARVEMRVDNPQLRLKPGMFVRANVVLERVTDAVVVPEQALVTRQGTSGVFLMAPDGASVSWRPVEVGVRQGDRVQIIADDLYGRVVVLGQQLLDDGSSVLVSEPKRAVTR